MLLVLPTPGKCFLPEHLKNSAADENIKPHTHRSTEAELLMITMILDTQKRGESIVIQWTEQ
jgi:hypothetical protein